MAHEEQLRWESRWALPAAAAAVVAAITQVVSYVLQAVAFNNKPHGDRGTLLVLHRHTGELWGAVAVQAAALLTLSGVLYYLFRATRYRRPQIPGALAPLILIGPAIFALGQVIAQKHAIDLSRDFVNSGVLTERNADRILKKTSTAGAALVIAGQLSVAFAYVFVGLNAMRAGLLSRFMGILGVIIGALVILPLFPGGPSVVQVFWLVALALLFAGAWPGGRGPAWASGEPQPWPTAQEIRERRLAALEARDEAAAGPEPEPEPVGGEPQKAPHPVSKKKSRKRRR